MQAELEYQQELAYYQQQQNLPVGYINPAGSPAGTEQTGTAGGIYTGPTPGVPNTSPYPSTIGQGFSQDQINQALDIIKGGTVGQPLNAPPSTTITPGTGLPGPIPLLPTTGAQADIVSTPDGQAMLVTSTVGSFAAPTAAVRTLTGGGSSGGGGTAPTALPPSLTLYGTDPSGNPIYSDQNGNLYNAGGQSVGSVGAPAVQNIRVYRPQPEPGGGGPPAGPITFPTPPGVHQAIGPPPSLAPQIPGQGGVPGTGIQGVTVNADGSLSFGQLPSTVLTTVQVGTGPGTTEDVGVVGSPPEVQAAMDPTFGQLEGIPQPVIVEPQPPPPAPIWSTGQPEPPGPPIIPAPPTPAPIDISGLVLALNAAVAGDVNAEKVTMNDFIAILNNIDSVGLTGTITALQAFHDNFAAHHSGPQSRSSQGAMQYVINQLQTMANSQPAEVMPLAASPAPVSTAVPATGIGAVTGLPTFPTAPIGALPTSPIITPAPVTSGGGISSPYVASNTGGTAPPAGFSWSQTPSAGGSGGLVPVSTMTTGWAPPTGTAPTVFPTPATTGGTPTLAQSALQATAQQELPKVMAMAAQFNAILSQHASGAMNDADALKQLTALQDALSVELEMIPSMGYLLDNVESQMNVALSAVAKKATPVSTVSATFTAPTTATTAAAPGYSQSTFQLTPEQGQQVQQTLNAEMSDMNAIINSYNSGQATAQATQTALGAFHDKYSNQALGTIFGGQTYPMIAMAQQDQMSSYHPTEDISTANPITTPTLQDVLTQPVPQNMLSLSTNSLTFGPQAIGTTSAPQTVGVGGTGTPVETPTVITNPADIPTALETAAWAAGIPTRGGVPDSPVPGFPNGGMPTLPAPTVAQPETLFGGGATSYTPTTNPPATVSTPMGQALLVTEGNPPTTATGTTTGAPTPNAPVSTATGGTTFTMSQTPTTPMPTTAPAPGMFWAWAGSSWQQEPLAVSAPNTVLPSAQGGAELTKDMLVNVHDEELILPPAISTGLKNIIAQQQTQSPTTQTPDTVSTPLGQAVLTADGNPPTTPTLPSPITARGEHEIVRPGLLTDIGTTLPTSPVITPSPVTGEPSAQLTLQQEEQLAAAQGWGTGDAVPTLPTSPIITPSPLGGGVAPTQTITTYAQYVAAGGTGTYQAWEEANSPSAFALHTPGPTQLPTSPLMPVGGNGTVVPTPQLYSGPNPPVGTERQSLAGAPTAPVTGAIWIDPQGAVWKWYPPSMSNDKGEPMSSEQPGYWYLVEDSAPPPNYQPPKQLWAVDPNPTGPPAPPPPANPSTTQTFTDAQGNVWTWAPPRMVSVGAIGSGQTTLEAGHWQLTTAAPVVPPTQSTLPTSPVITPSPITGGKPGELVDSQGNAIPDNRPPKPTTTPPVGEEWAWGGSQYGWYLGPSFGDAKPQRPPTLPTSPVITPSPITPTGGAPTSPLTGGNQVLPPGGSLTPTKPKPATPAPPGMEWIWNINGLWMLQSTWQWNEAGGGYWKSNPPAGGTGITPSASPTGLIPSLSSALSTAPSAASSFLSSTVRSFLPPPVTAAGGSVSPTIAGSAMAQVNAHLSATTQRVTLENQINSLSSTRVAAETQLVSLKMQEIQADMQRVAAHQNLLSQIKSAGTTTSGNALEELMNGLYQTRSRQGFGNFFGEISNAI